MGGPLMHWPPSPRRATCRPVTADCGGCIPRALSSSGFVLRLRIRWPGQKEVLLSKKLQPPNGKEGGPVPEAARPVCCPLCSGCLGWPPLGQVEVQGLAEPTRGGGGQIRPPFHFWDFLVLQKIIIKALSFSGLIESALFEACSHTLLSCPISLQASFLFRIAFMWLCLFFKKKQGCVQLVVFCIDCGIPSFSAFLRLYFDESFCQSVHICCSHFWMVSTGVFPKKLQEHQSLATAPGRTAKALERRMHHKPRKGLFLAQFWGTIRQTQTSPRAHSLRRGWSNSACSGMMCLKGGDLATKKSGKMLPHFSTFWPRLPNFSMRFSKIYGSYRAATLGQ